MRARRVVFLVRVGNGPPVYYQATRYHWRIALHLFLGRMMQSRR
jgi:hypothetical protein